MMIEVGRHSKPFYVWVPQSYVPTLCEDPGYAEYIERTSCEAARPEDTTSSEHVGSKQGTVDGIPEILEATDPSPRAP